MGEIFAEDEKLEEFDLNWQRWIMRSLGQMLIVAPSVSEKPLRTKIPISITQLIDELCNGNSAAFAERIGRTKTTVWGWMNLKQRIRLSDLLAACYWAQLAPVDLLLSDLGSAVRKSALFNRVRPSPPLDFEKPLRVGRSLDKTEIKAQLEALLESGNVPASWKEVAALLKIDGVHLRRLFPELSKLLVAECKKARALKKTNRDGDRRADIQNAIAYARNSQLPVSRRAIALILRNQSKTVDYRLISAMLREIRSYHVVRG